MGPPLDVVNFASIVGAVLACYVTKLNRTGRGQKTLSSLYAVCFPCNKDSFGWLSVGCQLPFTKGSQRGRHTRCMDVAGHGCSLYDMARGGLSVYCRHKLC